MKILFLGNFLPRKYEKIFKTLSAAGNQYQNNLIKTLKKENEVYSITYSGLPEVRLSYDERNNLKTDGVEVCLPKVDGYSKFFSYRKRIREVAKISDCIITYNVIYLWFGLKRLVKNNSCKLILVLADYTPPKEENGWRKIYSWLIGRQFSKFDKVILLSEKSKSYVTNVKECEIINGCIDWNMFENIEEKDATCDCVIAYTGYISKVTGIELLIDAFSKINNINCRLIISGQLDDAVADYIKQNCLNNSRIKYLGYVDKEKYLNLLQKTDILVNPRDMNFQQNKYNFPSKILEYLASGRIVVSTKFIGYENYEDYINFCDSTPESLADILIACYNKKTPLLKSSYNRNRKFVQQFTWDKQIRRYL